MKENTAGNIIAAFILLAVVIIVIDIGMNIRDHRERRIFGQIATTQALVTSTIGQVLDDLVVAKEQVRYWKEGCKLAERENDYLRREIERVNATLSEAKLRLREYISEVVE